MSPETDCPDCSEPADVSRRDFLKRSSVAIVGATASAPLLAGVSGPQDSKQRKRKRKQPETLVGEFYKTLTAPQKRLMVIPFDHPLRQKVDNNWRCTRVTVANLTGEQQAMVFDIVRGLHSPEYRKTVMAQIEHDNGGAARFVAAAASGTPVSSSISFWAKSSVTVLSLRMRTPFSMRALVRRRR